jgi:glycosyltransferase involved in cell wall biosynthesis
VTSVDLLHPDVTICIPAYEAEEFIRPAIESALAQTYPNISVLVSIDKGADETAAICREYEKDGRLRVIEHADRLGWVGNVNSLLGRVKTPFFCFLFHDDVLHESCIERLLALIKQHPEAIAVSGFVRYSGNIERIESLDSVQGTHYERLRAILVEPNTFFSLKSLHRSWPVQAGLRLVDNAFGGFQADAIFLIELVAHGTLISIPDVLYVKNIWNDSVTGRFRSWPANKWFEALAETRAARISSIHQAGLSPRQKRELTELVLAHFHPLGIDEAWNHAERNVTEYGSRQAAAIISRLLGNPVLPDDPAGDEIQDPVVQAYKARQLVAVARKLFRQQAVTFAAHYAQMALELDETSAEAHGILAQTLLHGELPTAGKVTEDALRHARAAARLAPDDPFAFYILALAFERAGQYSDAVVAAGKAEALAPGQQRPRALHGRLKEKVQSACSGAELQ